LNRLTAKNKAAIKEVVERFEAQVPAAFAGDSIAFLQCIYRDPNQELAVRLDAAKAAARFERPSLSAVATREVTPVPAEEFPDSRPPIEQFLVEFGQKVLDGEIMEAGAAEGFAPSATDQAQMPEPLASPAQDSRLPLPRGVEADVEHSRALDRAMRPTYRDHTTPEAEDKLAAFRGNPLSGTPPVFPDS
jgi:hypothetical protein